MIRQHPLHPANIIIQLSTGGFRYSAACSRASAPSRLLATTVHRVTSSAMFGTYAAVEDPKYPPTKGLAPGSEDAQQLQYKAMQKLKVLSAAAKSV